jgi:hypothetical protein
MPKRLQVNLLKKIEKKGAMKTQAQLEAKLMRSEIIRKNNLEALLLKKKLET